MQNTNEKKRMKILVTKRRKKNGLCSEQSLNSHEPNNVHAFLLENFIGDERYTYLEDLNFTNDLLITNVKSLVHEYTSPINHSICVYPSQVPLTFTYRQEKNSRRKKFSIQISRRGTRPRAFLANFVPPAPAAVLLSRRLYEKKFPSRARAPLQNSSAGKHLKLSGVARLSGCACVVVKAYEKKKKRRERNCIADSAAIYIGIYTYRFLL